MVKGKIFGVVLGGLGGFLLLNKGMDVVRDSVSYICDAVKWRGYYKYTNWDNCDAVPPGYEMHRSQTEDGVTSEKNVGPKKNDASETDKNSTLSDAVKQTIKDAFKGSEAAEEASEGQTEASERDVSGDADGDEVVTARDPDGKPIAGRFPWGRRDDIEAKEYEPQLYTDDLYDGVKDITGDDD